MGYLYRHIRLDKNEVFYIGIGGFSKREKCGLYSRSKEKSGRNKYWKNITNKSSYIVEIIIDNLTYEMAKVKEIEFISIYGRKDLGRGTLCNLTNGGDGSINVIVSNETKIKISNSLKGRIVTNETRMKISRSNTGNKHSVETKNKLSVLGVGNKNALGHEGVKGNKFAEGYKHTPEAKNKMSLSGKGNKNRLGKESGFKGKKHSDESKEMNRQKHLGKKPNKLDFSCSNETKIKIAEMLLGGKKIEIDGVIYNSYMEAENALGIKNKTIRYRTNSKSDKFKNYKLIDV